MNFKIGIYVRVSTEEQAKIINNSIECQIQRMDSFVSLKNQFEKNWGEIISTYRDEGYSAKDTKRPAYQKMLEDIRDKKINLILVNDLSRLSRNIADFCKFMEELQDYQVKFLSIREQFDSSTPIGEMMIFNIINLAQFERKQTSERVAINCHTRALQELLNGGQKIIGYRRDSNDKSLITIDNEEAILVKAVFDTYLSSNNLQETVTIINDTFHLKKRMNPSLVRRILKNKAYIGLKEINKKYKQQIQDQLKPWQQYQVVKSVWPAIIPELVFNRVQEKMKENRSNKNRATNTTNARIYPLSGLLKCSVCNTSLVGQGAHGKTKIYHYYGHSKNRAKKCSFKNIRADKIESYIFSYLISLANSKYRLEQIPVTIFGIEKMRNVLIFKLNFFQKNLTTFSPSLLKTFCHNTFRAIYCSSDCLKIYFSLDEILRFDDHKMEKEMPMRLKNKSHFFL